MNHCFRNTPPTQRTEIPEYPIEAIRETVINAVIHRDYLLPYDIQIKIFDKEITIYNPGKLLGNLTFDDLLTDNYQAYARNKLIAEAFYLTGDIEKYGSGFRRVREYTVVYPTMKTEFKEVPNGLLFTYSYTIQKNTTKPPYYTPEMLNDAVAKREIESNKITLNKKLGEKLGENQQRILSLILENYQITIAELSQTLNISDTAVENNIAKLKARGLLERIGPAKGGYWKVLEDSKKIQDTK